MGKNLRSIAIALYCYVIIALYDGIALGQRVAAFADIQSRQDEATARGTWLAWVVSNADLEHPGRLMARAHTADHCGGVYLPGAVVVERLDKLRAQLPAGLTCSGRAPFDSPDVVEVWG